MSILDKEGTKQLKEHWGSTQRREIVIVVNYITW